MFRNLVDVLFKPPRPEYKNRDIREFKGSVLNIAGTIGEVESYGERFPKLFTSDITPLDIVYTVNDEEKECPDLLADAGSLKDMASLPDKRFDIVYFSHISTCYKYGVNFVNAFKTVGRVIKDDGVLLYAGNPMAVYGQPQKIAFDKRYKIERAVMDFEKIAKNVGFMKYVEIDDGSPLPGSLWIASKLPEIDLVKKRDEFPILEVILRDHFRMTTEQAAKYLKGEKIAASEQESSISQAPKLGR